MLKTHVDKILELLNENPSMAVSEIAQKLGTTPDIVQTTGKQMEEEGLLRIDYKFMRPYLVMNKKQEAHSKKPLQSQTNKVLSLQNDVLDSPQLQEEGTKPDKQYAMLQENEQHVAETIPANANIGQANPQVSQFPMNVGNNAPKPHPVNSSYIPIDKPNHNPEKKPMDEVVASKRDEQQRTAKTQTPSTLPMLESVPEAAPDDGYENDIPGISDHFSVPGPVESQMNSQGYAPVGNRALPTHSFEHSSVFDTLKHDKMNLGRESEKPKEPDNLDLTEIEQLDNMITHARDLYDDGNFQEAHDLYANIYAKFNDIVDMSPNERELFKRKIQSLFHRIRQEYMSKIY